MLCIEWSFCFQTHWKLNSLSFSPLFLSDEVDGHGCTVMMSLQQDCVYLARFFYRLDTRS